MSELVLYPPPWAEGLSCKLTDEGDGGGEAGPDVSGEVVLHSQPQVLKLPLVEIGARGGNIEHGRDARRHEGLSAGGVEGAAQIQEGQQLHGTILYKKRARLFLGKERGASLPC